MSSVRHPSAPPLVWLGALVTLLACGAISAALIFAGRAERTSTSAELFRRRLELLDVELDLVYAADRLEALALLEVVTGTHAEDLDRAQAGFDRQLASVAAALGEFPAAHRGEGGPAEPLLRAVEAIRHDYPRPETAAESLSVVAALYGELDWVPLTPPEGKWYELCSFVYDLQVAAGYGFDTADEYLARLWETTRPETDPAAKVQIESLVAALRALDSQTQDPINTRWMLDPILDSERAEALGPDFVTLVADLRSRPGAQVVRDVAPFLLHRTPDPIFSPDELWQQMADYSELLRAGARRALELADSRIAREEHRAQSLTLAARVSAGVLSLVAVLVLLAIELHRRRFNRDLRRLAETDTLTGLYNRHALRTYEGPRMGDGRRGGFALIHLDLDNFKAINDSFGHPIGDRALVAFAGCCRRAVRAVDTVARVGGDEFVIVLHGLSNPEQEAREVARRVHESLAEPVDCGGRRLRLQVSIGIATATAATDLDEMMVEADLALFAAKERGSNHHEVFVDSIRRELLRDLPRALASGELECVYQPQVDLESGEVVGVEVLARWPASQLASVPVRKVIDAVEWMGGTLELLHCLLVRVAVAHEAAGGLFEGRFWVNLSPADLAVSDAADGLLEAFRACRLPLDRLGAEVTESRPIADIDQAIEVLRRLSAAGIGIAIDDFGRGNTPLRNLAQLPIDLVKLDRGVVSRIDVEPSKRVLTSAARFICEAHRIALLAEGVETAREVAVLRELGVRQAQGFAFAPPLALPELIDYLRSTVRPAHRAAAGPGSTADGRRSRVDLRPVRGNSRRWS